MAEETVVTNIVANANFSGLISDLNRVTASLANLQTQVSATNKGLASQIAVVNRQFGDTLRSTGQFATHFASAGSDVETFGKNLDKGRLKLRDYYRTWQDHHKTAGGLIRDLAQQQVRLQNAIMQPLGRNAEGMMQFAVHVPRGLDVIKNKTALTHQELKIMNRVMQEGANQLINWGKNTQWAGRQLTVGLTVPLAAFGKAAADAFRTADQELVRLTKVYGDIAGASARDLGMVREEVTATAKELASSLGASFRDTLALGADIAATGATGQELLGSIRETTRLAILGEVDRQEAMKATLAIQTAFNQNTTELAESINFLNAVENQTSTTLNDLVEAIPRAGTIIKGLGGSVQDLALYLTAMREGGVSASEGANALKSALGSLINPTDVAVRKFESFGIDLLGIVNNNAGNVTNTLFALQAALDKLDPLQKQQAIEQLFGKFQFARLGALFDNLGRQGSQTLQVLDLMKASSQDLANIAGRELSMVTESASGKYRRAIEELKADLASVGEQFLTINTYLIKFVDRIIDFANNLPGPIKSILSFLGGVTAIAGPLIMLTGVLGNFFGYIVKGAYHFKALFKGAEGWKLLTPEILAANRAGSMAESTFYSDARAAAILTQSLRDLSVQYDSLAMKAQSGAISVQPMLSTLAGAPIVGGGGRVVDPKNPLAGTMGTRASAHMVPRGVQQPGTIFGLVPSSIPVNLAVGQNPQVYMEEALPPIPGVTTVQTKKYGQVSTGIVASEAARHHAMTAALAMQSTKEVENLKKMMATTGTVTTDFMQTFDDLVPITSQITQSAAQQSSAIVAELRAGKISVDAARQKIIALNLEIERMLGAAATEYAATTGRTINLTNVPTLNQPVVTATGKSNMRELFKGRTRGFFSSVGRALGVRTSGAGYNIQTTIPKKFKNGAVAIGMPMQKYARGIVGAGLTLGRAVAQKLGLITSRSAQESYKFKTVSGVFGKDIPGMTREGVNKLLETNKMPVGPYISSLLSAGNGMVRGGTDAFIGALVRQGIINPKQADDLLMQISSNYISKVSRKQFIGDATNPYWTESNKVIGMAFKDNPAVRSLWKQFSAKSPVRTSVGEYRSSTYKNISLDYNGQKIPISQRAFRGSGDTMFLHATNPTNFGKNVGRYQNGVTKVPGYGGGDIIPALIEPGESVVTKEATRKYAPIISAMNSNSLPGFQEGVTDAGGRGGRFATGVGSLLIGSIGGQMAGQRLGGSTGGLLGSIIGPIVLNKIFSVSKALISAAKAGGGFVNVLKAMSTVLRANPWGIAITGILAVAAGLYKMYDNARKARQASVDALTVNQEQAKQLGINYQNLSDKINNATKAAADQRKLLLAKAATSMQVGGGLMMTVKELREMKKEALATKTSVVEMFNSMKDEDVLRAATDLKVQLVASGKSAREAAKEIFAIISASNKADLAVKAISSKSFMDIVNKSSAATVAAESFVNAMRAGASGKEMFAAFEAGTAAVSSYFDSLVGTKNAAGEAIDTTEALTLTIDKMNKSSSATKQIGEENYKVLIKQNPALINILGSSDSILSSWIKIKLYTSGVQGDLSSMSQTDARNLLLTLDSITAAAKDMVTNTELAGNGLDALADLTAAWKNESTNAKRVADDLAKRAKRNADEEIAAIDKKIEKIKEEAEARKQAIQDQQDAESFGIQIQKEQLTYQNLIASGNLEAAAQSQLRIRQLVSENEKKKTLAAIDKKANEDVKKLEEERNGILKSIADAQKAATKAQEAAAKAAEKYAKIQVLQNSIAATLSRAAYTKQGTEEFTALTRAFESDVKALAALGKEGAAAARSLSPQKTGTATIEGPFGTPIIITKFETWGDKLTALTEQNIGFAKEYFKQFGGDVKKFGEYVDDLLNNANKGTAENPYSAVRGQDLGIDVAAFERSGIGPNSVQQQVKKYAETMQYGTGVNFILSSGNKSDKTYMEYQFKVDKDGNVKLVKKAAKLNAGGYIKGYQPGGSVRGPGTSTSDSIPAYLSNGEYVIRASSVNKYGKDLFDGLNAQRFNMGGYAPYSREIGSVLSSSTKSNYVKSLQNDTMGNVIYNVAPVINAAPGMDEMALAKMASDITLRTLEKTHAKRTAMNGRDVLIR